MSNTIVLLGIAIISIICFIYVIKNFKDLLPKIEKYKDNKILKIIFIVFLSLLTIYFLYSVYTELKLLNKNVEWYKVSKANDELYDKYDELMRIENNYYKEKMNINYENQKYNEPYIPDGFSYVEGDWKNGFVIQDSNNNQYVWVPCTNKENTESVILERKNWSTQDIVSKDLCNNDEYEKFIQSALENGGFYISRYEIGKENEKPVSKPGVETWIDINRNKANEVVAQMYNNINCKLVNGYAYDTTLSWIMKNNTIEPNIIDVENNENLATGRKSYNNIFDFTDNIMEITGETTYANPIVRGFPYEIDEESQKLSLGFGYEVEDFGRFSIQEEENFFTITTKLAFRTILYK